MDRPQSPVRGSSRLPLGLGTLLLLLLSLVAAAPAAADPRPNPSRDNGLQKALDALNDRARAYGLANQAPPSAPVAAVAENFEVIGHNDLGRRDTNADVWVHGNFAYVGTWGFPCTGRGVKIVDVSDLAAPRAIGAVGSRQGTSAEDVVVRRVATPFFTGDLLVVGLQRCGSQTALDRQEFGPELWDVTNPYRPRKLGFIGSSTGGGGVHELDLFQRGSRVYALLAVPFSEWFDPSARGDFRIVDVTNPRAPVEVSHWGAGAAGFAPGPFFGQGSFAATFAHSARASADGTKAYVSYWDLGVLTFDITDVANPVLLSRTLYDADADGDAHSVAEYRGTTRHFLLQNDEDADPRSPARIFYGPGGSGLATESPGGTALWLAPGHSISAPVARAAGQGCSAADYPAGAVGKIAVVRTPFPFFDAAAGEMPQCSQTDQEAAAAAAGAAAVVHEFESTATSPQWWDFGAVEIPVLFTNVATAEAMVAAGSATLVAGTPSYGFLRVYDAATGMQVAKFDAAPNVHALPAPEGEWTIHNNEVVGNRSYVSWYSNGVVALDLTPLNASPPADPVQVGRFAPQPVASAIPFVGVWGVVVRESDNVVFASDLGSGLWIVRPTGPAAP